MVKLPDVKIRKPVGKPGPLREFWENYWFNFALVSIMLLILFAIPILLHWVSWTSVMLLSMVLTLIMTENERRIRNKEHKKELEWIKTRVWKD